ncbi:MAG: J domain-containing protein, partial [Acidimicrobiales bacterium]
MAALRPDLAPYQVLGVSPLASRAEVSRAYKVLAQIFHPDRFAESPKSVRDEAEYRMMVLNDAYALARKGLLIGRPPGANGRRETNSPTAAQSPGEAASAGVP